MAETQATAPLKKALKRKRAAPLRLDGLSPEEKESMIGALTAEIDGLLRYCREVMADKLGMEATFGDCGSINGQIALLMEESELPLSALVEKIHGVLRVKNEGLTAASVKSGLLLVGQRLMYGVSNPDADVLEDDSPSALWCWETREVKLLPKAAHVAVKVRRKCRKKIHERISAVSEALSALQMSDGDQNCKLDLVKASEKLAKALAESDIRALVDSLAQRSTAMAEKEAERDEKAIIKQQEKSQKKAEKEKKKTELELQKEKLKADKEAKRLQEEAEKEHKRREREESILSKQIRKQQEEAEKDQRRREKEEAALKQQLSVQKQASIMERFLKKAKTSASSPCQLSIGSLNKCNEKKESFVLGAVTCLMDPVLSSNQECNAENIFKSHLSSWHSLGCLIRSNKNQHWGLRRKPKTELIKEIKLTNIPTDRGLAQDDESSFEKLVDECRERVSDEDLNCTSDWSHLDARKYKRRRQLLQFDKSHRPAFYGIWPQNSNVVGPRHPFRKDPELDYDVDSDEEWEEEEPGESLSDLEKDEDESLDEGCSKADEEDESVDGFFVPDGHLSENEGVQIDRMEIDIAEARSASCEQVESEDFLGLLRQQKYLQSVTEHALRKNQPLIISNLRHEKPTHSNPEELTGTAKLEFICLQALSIRKFPREMALDFTISDNADEEEDCPPSSKSSKTPSPNQIAVSDSDLRAIVSTIQSCSKSSINMIVECLQQKFPATPRTRLRKTVRETANFVDNSWLVKKEVQDKLGLSISPGKSSERTKSIAAFFSKRCLPPAVKGHNSDNTTP